jgi:hypothetical protein
LRYLGINYLKGAYRAVPSVGPTVKADSERTSLWVNNVSVPINIIIRDLCWVGTEHVDGLFIV